jgi:hypothetical protein
LLAGGEARGCQSVLEPRTSGFSTSHQHRLPAWPRTSSSRYFFLL